MGEIFGFLFYFYFLSRKKYKIFSLCVFVSVLRAASWAAPCCSPAHTGTVGHRLGAAETGASIPGRRGQSEHAAPNSQPAGVMMKHSRCWCLCFSDSSWQNKDLIPRSKVKLPWFCSLSLLEAIFHPGSCWIFGTEPVGQSVEGRDETFRLDAAERYIASHFSFFIFRNVLLKDKV